MEDYNPYNDKNIEINKDNIQKILETYHVYYTIHNIELFKRSFIHRSYITPTQDIKIVEKPFHCLDLKNLSNERLEFLGDGILECITKFYLYRTLCFSGNFVCKCFCSIVNDDLSQSRLYKWSLFFKFLQSIHPI